ncbi:MAG: 4-hydroxybenzoyl-CoA reductase subunit alpha [Actinobacteria bacterium ADurb.Bin444]|nr:MAG: 4-hydroxybenzoyl-CoA reductase subunit alpha [Actinobacteria bacterium ADurb.Bin444]
MIGKSRPRVDGVAKVSGGAVYADDLRLPGMLVGKMLRSPHAHARIVRIDTTAAEQVPGVKAVATGRDLPETFGILPVSQDEYPLALHKVRYIGDPVAAVAAVDEDTVRRALDLVEVEYEVLPAILDPEEALTRDDVKIHDHAEEANVERRVHLVFGDVEDGFRRAHLIRKDRFTKKGASHAPLEPHAVVAEYTDGALTLWSSTQVPHYVHRALSRVLGLPMSHIRVIKPMVGGGFGGKGEPVAIEFVASVLAMKSGRPVKMVHEREEVFLTNRGRHPYVMDLETGVTAEGVITAFRFHCLLDGGAYGSFGIVTLYYSGQLLTLPYVVPAFEFSGERVYTNKPACGAQRGHGGVAPRFAFEVHLDRIAEELGIDPLEIRRRNRVREGHVTVNDLQVTSCGFEECLDEAASGVAWAERRGRLPRGRGVGIAGGVYVSGAALPIYFNDSPHSNVVITAGRDGSITVLSGAADIGQGSDTMLALVAAEVLGVPLEAVRVVSADTGITPVDLGSYSSRVTFMAGNACMSAAQELKAALIDAVGSHTDRPAAELEFRDGAVWGRGEDVPLMTLGEAVAVAETSGRPVSGAGGYKPPKLGGKYRGAGVGPSPAYSFGAHAAEVEVDERTGEVRVLKLVAAHDLGRALNPVAAEGQVEGAAVMGIGETLSEVFETTGTGCIGVSDLLEYRVPTALDVPPVEPVLVESGDPQGPFGAKEVGEGSLHPAIPAIVNAVYDAVGVWVHDLPLEPHVVRAALARARAAASADSTAPGSVDGEEME